MTDPNDGENPTCPSIYAKCPADDQRCILEPGHDQALHFNRAGFARSAEEGAASASRAKLAASDPNETANVVGEITEAWCEHLAEEAAKRPVTYNNASTGNIVDQIDRYRELADHDTMARSIATLKARGTYVPNEHVNEEKFPPLTVAEHLEMLALGERIARYYRHPSQVDKAVRAGASWQQVADATGTTPEAARAAYREWAEGQHKYAGMGDGEYSAALERAGGTDAGGAR